MPGAQLGVHTHMLLYLYLYVLIMRYLVGRYLLYACSLFDELLILTTKRVNRYHVLICIQHF